jgi:hypothetical protein
MDRFTDGGDVPIEVLRQAWESTTQGWTAVCDRPLWEEFYRAVRTVNASKPPENRIRILLGDPPLDWEMVRSRTDVDRWVGDRDRYPAELIQREVLAKGRRAMVVYGDGHLQRKNIVTNYESLELANPVTARVEDLADTLVNLLERAGAKVFTVWTNTSADLVSLQPDVSSWPRPTLTLLQGTVLGAADFAFYYPAPVVRLTRRDGRMTPLPREEWRELPTAEQFDALLYLGPPSSITFASIAMSRCNDPDYMRMRSERLAIMGNSPGELERLKQACAASK